ncbi:MAG: polyprenyl synthetase family protein [Chloroflexota bacterium]
MAEAERALLAAADFPEDLAAFVLVALSGSDSVLGRAPDPRWARLPLLACASATSGDARPAVPLAVAVEVQAAAYSLLDDLENGDDIERHRRAGAAVALNVAAALLALGQQALLRVPAPAAAVLGHGWVGLCRGQHQDLTLSPDGPDPLGAALQAAEGKTAGVVAAATAAGALVGGADRDLVTRYRRFGHAVGMAGQLANDLLGLQPGPDGASDLSRGGYTVPILFALGEQHATAVRAVLRQARAGEAVPALLHVRALDELTNCGAQRFTWLLLQQTRGEAEAAMAAIATDRPVHGTLDRLVVGSFLAAGPAE